MLKIFNIFNRKNKEDFKKRIRAIRSYYKNLAFLKDDGVVAVAGSVGKVKSLAIFWEKNSTELTSINECLKYLNDSDTLKNEDRADMFINFLQNCYKYVEAEEARKELDRLNERSY